MRFGMPIAAAMAAVLLVPAWADPAGPLPQGAAAGTAATDHSPLKPGKAAGVRQAQEVRGGLFLLGAGGLIAGVVLLAAGGGGNGTPTEPQASVTTTTP